MLLLALLILSTTTNAESPDYSCKSCNIFQFPFSGSTGYSIISSCLSMSCDSSITPGPLCVTPFALEVSCNNTLLEDSSGGFYKCNCDGPATPPTSSPALPLSASALANLKPLTCSPPPIASTACPVTTESCSLFVSGYSENQCVFLLPPAPGDPATTRYDASGYALTCDGTVHPSYPDLGPTFNYACACGPALELSVAQSLQSAGESAPMLVNCNAQNSSEILVDVNTAMNMVTQSNVQLTPILDVQCSV